MAMTYEKPKVDWSARYTVTQTANLLGVHRNTVGKYLKSGVLPYSMRLSKRLISGDDILKMWKRKDKKKHEFLP